MKLPLWWRVVRFPFVVACCVWALPAVLVFAVVESVNEDLLLRADGSPAAEDARWS